MSSWGWGNTIFEITIFTWVFKYEVQKLSFFFFIFIWIHCFFANLKNVLPMNNTKEVCKRFFDNLTKPTSIWVLVGGLNFRLSTCNVPEGPSNNPYGEARRDEFCEVCIEEEPPPAPCRLVMQGTLHSSSWALGETPTCLALLETFRVRKEVSTYCR